MVKYGNAINLSCLLLRRKRNSDHLPLNKKYRSHFEIIASILEVTEGNGVVVSSLLKHSRMSYELLKKYLAYLNELGLIEADVRGSKIVYSASAKGLGFLRQYYILQEMLLSNTQNKHNDQMPPVL